MAASTTYHNEPTEAHEITVEKVRFDYVRTLTDLYIENMLRPFADFLHSQGILLRSEISYGLPFELTRPGPEVDGIETESLEFAAQIDAYRLLAGPAHLFGKQYSSETGATTRNHILDHRFYDQIIATQLAAGITKTVLHGWASTAGAEGVTEWPGHEGMWPMFSERFDTRQPGGGVLPAVERGDRALPVRAAAGQPADRRRHPAHRPLHRQHVRASASSIPTDAGCPTRRPTAGAGCVTGRTTGGRTSACRTPGWTYEFFDGSLLLRDDVSFADGARAARRTRLPGVDHLPERARRRCRRAPARLGSRRASGSSSCTAPGKPSW